MPIPSLQFRTFTPNYSRGAWDLKSLKKLFQNPVLATPETHSYASLRLGAAQNWILKPVETHPPSLLEMYLLGNN